MPTIEVHRSGSGKPLLLIHGLGASWQSWSPCIGGLAAEREVIAVHLPGHGGNPPSPGSDTFKGLADSVEAYILDNGMKGVDVVGVSLGGRLVLELARRGSVGNVVALSPGGFWRGWERTYFKVSLSVAVKLLQLLRSKLPSLSRSVVARSALMAQFSAHPSALTPDLVAGELKAFADTPTAGALIRNLADGPEQTGPSAPSTGRVTIGWGRKDRLCMPHQASRATAAFPEARLHWFDESGHYSIWDEPEATVRLILEGTAGQSSQSA